METDRQAMDVWVAKVGKCGDARNSRAVTETGSRNRIPNWGEFPGNRPSSAGDQSWQIPDLGEKGYMFRGRRNYRRYEDYGGQNRPGDPDIDNAGGWAKNQMYLQPHAHAGDRTLLPQCPEMGGHVVRNPPGLACGPNVTGGKLNLRPVGFRVTPWVQGENPKRPLT